MSRIVPILAVLCFASAAAADTKTEPYAGLTLEQLFDSNVMNARGEDAVTRITPRLGLLLENERLTLGGEYRLGLHAYARGTADNTINHRGSLGTVWAATPRLKLKGDAVLLIGDDPVLLDRPGVAIPQGAFFDIVANAGASYRYTRRIDLSMNYMLRRSRFDLAGGMDPLAFDGDEHRVDAAASYKMSRRLTGSVLGRTQHFVSYGTSTSLGDASGGGLGLDYRFTERIRGRVYGGPVWFFGTGAGYFAGGDLTRTGQRWRLALRAFHDIYGGTSASEAVWFDTVQLDGTWKLAKKLDLRVRAGAYRGGVAPNYDMNVSGLIATGQLGWQLARNTRVELYAEERAQDADGGIAFGNVQRTVAGLRLATVIGSELSSIGALP